MISKISTAFLELITSLRRLGDGGLGDLRTWADVAERPRLIVIDTFACVRPPRSSKDNSYDSDYAALSPLQLLAAEKQLAIVIVHHVRKMESDDPLDTVSGTTGLTGAADSILVLNRDNQGITLYGRGRAIDEIETAMSFDRTTGAWSILGQASDVRRSDERSGILDALRDSAEAMSPTAIASALDMPVNNVKQLLFKMVKSGEVAKTKRGQYLNPLNLVNPITNGRAPSCS